MWLNLAWFVKRSNHHSEPTLWYVINTQVSVAGSGLVCKEIKPWQWTHSLMLSIHKSVWLDLAWSVERSNHSSEPTLWYVINTQVSVAGSGLVCREIKPQQWTHSDMLSIHKSVWLDLAWPVERSNHHSEPTLWYVINTQVSVAGSGLVCKEIKPPQWTHSLMLSIHKSVWLDLAWSVERSNHSSEPTLWYVINTQVSVAGSGLVCREIKPQQWTHSDMLSIHMSVWLDLAWPVERSNHRSEPTLWYVINTQVSVAGSGLVCKEIKPPQWIHSLVCYQYTSQCGWIWLGL